MCKYALGWTAIDFSQGQQNGAGQPCQDAVEFDLELIGFIVRKMPLLAPHDQGWNATQCASIEVYDYAAGAKGVAVTDHMEGFCCSRIWPALEQGGQVMPIDFALL